MDDEITALAARWMELVQADHHKDKDCHFYVTKYWDYNKPPYYRAHHYGYIAGDWQSPKCATAAGAEGMLTRFLREHIRSLEDHEDNWDD